MGTCLVQQFSGLNTDRVLQAFLISQKELGDGRSRIMQRPAARLGQRLQGLHEVLVLNEMKVARAFSR
jgi:hypothetical protein